MPSSVEVVSLAPRSLATVKRERASMSNPRARASMQLDSSSESERVLLARGDVHAFF